MKPRILSLLCLMTACGQVHADPNQKGFGEPDTGPIAQKKEATGKQAVIPLKYGANQEKRMDPAMLRWRNNRVGQFIHYGLYAIPAGTWKGKTYSFAAEWLPKKAKVPREEWAELRHQFNPVNLKPKEWAAMAKSMGMRSLMITTKHHDGFCLWPSKYTDFDIENTPYKKDLLGEIIKAYDDAGIDVILYYSVLDWHHLGWRDELKTKEDHEAFETVKAYTRNQCFELLERYPFIKGFWFDGTWNKSYATTCAKFSYDLEHDLKAKKPGLLINCRLRVDEHGSRNSDSNGKLMADFKFLERVLATDHFPYDWEAGVTLPENQWGYHADWTLSHVKSTNEVIEQLAQSIAYGGGFRLNFGPKPDGTFRAEEVKVAGELAKWMAVNSEAIHHCSSVDFKKQDWGYFTRNTETNETYMIVCNIPIMGKLRVQLSNLTGDEKKHNPVKQNISSAKILGSGESLGIERYDSDEFLLELRKKDFSAPFVVKLEIAK
ncbi:MAG: alpha-L-fucosidase [Akkermansiaceae bacterium]|nr:alpha-L-fucosidase [Akkermansiaceae bacterium]